MAVENRNRATVAYLNSIGVNVERGEEIIELGYKKRILGQRMLDTILTASRLRRQRGGIKALFSSLSVETPKVFNQVTDEQEDLKIGLWLSSDSPANGATLNNALFSGTQLQLTEAETMAAVDRVGNVVFGHQIDSLSISSQIIATDGLAKVVSRINGAIQW